MKTASKNFQQNGLSLAIAWLISFSVFAAQPLEGPNNDVLTKPSGPVHDKSLYGEVQKESESSPNETYSQPEEKSHNFAVGLNIGWITRQDYGARKFRRFNPELVGYFYGTTGQQNLFWRAGTRLGYSSHQPEMPQAMRLEEKDTTLLFEGGLIWEWYVIPTATLGVGYDFRTITVKTKGPIDSADSRLNRKERLLVKYMQFGGGLPIAKGLIVIEPHVRYFDIQYDDRAHWHVGVEFTVGI